MPEYGETNSNPNPNPNLSTYVTLTLTLSLAQTLAPTLGLQRDLLQDKATTLLGLWLW